MKRRKMTPDLNSESLGGDVCTDQEHRERLDRYSRAKRHQLTVIDYIQHDPELHKEYRKMCDCGQYLVFQHWFVTGYRKLVGGFSCQKHLLCQACSLRRDSRYMREYVAKIEKVLSENPRLVVCLVTRTVKNDLDLLERYTHLGDIHRVLMQWRRDSLKIKTTARGRSTNSIMQHVAGSVGTYEFGRGANSDGWHPHIHEIVLLEPVFEFTEREKKGWKRDEETGEWEKAPRTVHVPLEFESRLAQEYWMISGDSYILDARRVDCYDENGMFVQDQLVNALCEVFKYALKFNELSFADQVHAYKTLKGRRLIFSYGCLRGVKVDDYLKDPEREVLEVGPYAYELYSFINKEYHFSRHLDNDEYEDNIRTADEKRRLDRLIQREEYLDRGDVLLENGLRIDEEKIRKHLESGEVEESVPF